MKIVPILVRQDNYAYLLIDEETKEAAAVDIFDVPKVVAKAKEEGVSITSLLTTHHHQDHSGGNAAFVCILTSALLTIKLIQEHTKGQAVP